MPGGVGECQDDQQHYKQGDNEGESNGEAALQLFCFLRWQLAIGPELLSVPMRKYDYSRDGHQQCERRKEVEQIDDVYIADGAGNQVD